MKEKCNLREQQSIKPTFGIEQHIIFSGVLFLLTDGVVDIVWREKDEGSFSVCVVLSFGTWRGGGKW